MGYKAELRLNISEVPIHTKSCGQCPSPVPSSLLVNLQCFLVHSNYALMRDNRELSMKSLKEERNHGFDPSLRKLSIKGSLAPYVYEPILKVG